MQKKILSIQKNKAITEAELRAKVLELAKKFLAQLKITAATRP